MRWESPAVRYELIVGRTVNVVNFDVVRLLSMCQNLNSSTIIHLVALTSDIRHVNIFMDCRVSLARFSVFAEG